MKIDDIKLEIKKALDCWDFELVDKICRKYSYEKEIEEEYIDFLYQTGKFIQLKKINPSFNFSENLIANLNFELLKMIDSDLCDLDFAKELLKKYFSYRSNDMIIGKNFFLCSIINYFYFKDIDAFFLDTYIGNVVSSLLNRKADLEKGAKKYQIFFENIKHNKNCKNLTIKTLRKVALCFFGSFRGDYISNINDNCTIIKDFNVDVIVSTWNNYCIWPGFGGNNALFKRMFPEYINKKTPKEIKASQNFMKIFPKTSKKLRIPIVRNLREDDLLEYITHIKYCKIINEQEFDSFCKRNINSDGISRVNNYKVIYQLYQISKAIEESEISNGYKYDFVIICRPDMKISGEIKIEMLERLAFNEIYENIHHLGNDVAYFMGRRDSILQYCNLWKYAKFNSKLDIFRDFPNFNNFSIHDLMSKWASINGIITLDIKKIIQRRPWSEALCVKGYKIPNIIDELQEDIRELYRNNLFDEKKIQEFIDFFNLVKEVYPIISKDEEHILNSNFYHYTAKSRIQNQLSYKLGQAMIVNSKSLLGYIRMPFVLSYIKDKHKQEQKIYQEKIKKDPSLKLPPLENYPNYQEALKEKECFTYKLGEALIKANKTWYKGGYIRLMFEVGKLKKKFKKK